MRKQEKKTIIERKGLGEKRVKRCFRKDDAIMFDYDLTRTKRKTVEVVVFRNGKVGVKAPYWMSRLAIENFLSEKSAWIQKHVGKAEEQNADCQPKKFADGETYFYLGNEYTLKTGKQTDRGVRISGKNLLIGGAFTSSDERCRRLEKWYREKAKEHIAERVRQISEQTGYVPNRITVKTQRKRWGSCSSRRNVNFNWKLIMLPEKVIDYVIIHELCHLKEMNHSKAFWGEVERIMPDYRQYRKWLKDNAGKVEWE